MGGGAAAVRLAAFARPSSQPQPGIARAVWVLALAGGVIRAALGAWTYPWGGDPIFSYAYRGLLISRGEFDAVTLMQHPPGYPLLLGALTTITGGSVPPHVWGVFVSAVSAAALVLVVDRLVATRTSSRATRLTVAAFLALYEGLVANGSAAMSEPLFLLLLYGAVALLDDDAPGRRRMFLAGGLLGLAGTVRVEGLGPLIGVAMVLALWYPRQIAWNGTDRRARLALFAAGAAAGYGWFALTGDYWLYSLMRDNGQPAAAGGLIPIVSATVMRLPALAYAAVTDWLPHVLLLPFWLLAAVGLADLPPRARERRLHMLLAAVVVPTLVGVAVTIMHKRTGTFLLPAAAIYVGFGAAALARRVGSPGRRALVLAGVLAAIAASPLQILYRLSRDGIVRDPTTFVQAGLLRAQPPGPVWGFGGEPEIYYYSRRPVMVPERALAAHHGDPRGLVGELRSAGFTYLTFAVSADATDGPIEAQPFTIPSRQPLRQDLLALVASADRYGLRLLGTARAERGSRVIYLFGLS
jgi:hypothetical protein